MSKLQIFKYILLFLLTACIVTASFFMPEINESFSDSIGKSYKYRTNKTSYSLTGNVPYAMRFTENFSSAEENHDQVNLSTDEVKNIAEKFFYSMTPWKYGCDLEFISAVPKLCTLDNNDKAIVWEIKYHSVAIKSTIVFAVNDTANIVIGFCVYNDETEINGYKYLTWNFQRYIEKYLPSISLYYNWSTAYSSADTILNGLISYKIAFVDNQGNSASTVLYYDYRYNNIIFNMEEDIIEKVRGNEVQYMAHS